MGYLFVGLYSLSGANQVPGGRGVLLVQASGPANSQGLVTQLDGGGSGGGLDRGVSFVLFLVSESNSVVLSPAAGGGSCGVLVLAGGSPASGVSSLLRLLSGWAGCRLPVPRHRSVLVVVVVQVTGATEASMAAQWHKVLQRQETYQEGGALLDGGAVEVGEGSDLT